MGGAPPEVEILLGTPLPVENLDHRSAREWFCIETSRLGIPGRHLDAFCGGVPKSVLARRYPDYSPRVLKTVYEKADLKRAL